ncbi:unnamed protein product [Vicia faba]|uniref:Major facilitator superfamily (MFS) profile domain-containing protein n=1 Tax=Vicia faba TaxID=3906 RepID=A0AAV1AJT8_VICFA|nr:unnamed protein product [Vicia faba]
MIIDQGDKEVQNTSLNKYALACALVASMVSIVSGYDTGVMSGAMIFIKEDLGISDTQQEILAGILNVCALVGSLTAGRTSDVIGRRYTIFLASILFIIGAILMGYGPNYAVIILLMLASLYQLVEDKLKLSKYLSWTFCSCAHGKRKPDTEFYIDALKHLKVDPAYCIFIDDRPKNVEAATEVGIKGVHFKNVDLLCQELSLMGIDI